MWAPFDSSRRGKKAFNQIFRDENEGTTRIVGSGEMCLPNDPHLSYDEEGEKFQGRKSSTWYGNIKNVTRTNVGKCTAVVILRNSVFQYVRVCKMAVKRYRVRQKGGGETNEGTGLWKRTNKITDFKFITTYGNPGTVEYHPGFRL